MSDVSDVYFFQSAFHATSLTPCATERPPQNQVIAAKSADNHTNMRPTRVMLVDSMAHRGSILIFRAANQALLGMLRYPSKIAEILPNDGSQIGC
jgi:hypothetical protein